MFDCRPDSRIGSCHGVISVVTTVSGLVSQMLVQYSVMCVKMIRMGRLIMAMLKRCILVHCV